MYNLSTNTVALVFQPTWRLTMLLLCYFFHTFVATWSGMQSILSGTDTSGQVGKNGGEVGVTGSSARNPSISSVSQSLYIRNPQIGFLQFLKLPQKHFSFSPRSTCNANSSFKYIYILLLFQVAWGIAGCWHKATHHSEKRPDNLTSSVPCKSDHCFPRDHYLLFNVVSSAIHI